MICVLSEEHGDGEGVVSSVSCVIVSEYRGDGEGVGSVELSLLPDTQL
jgi:hypothetical protein